MTIEAYIGLGANLGDAKQTLQDALTEIKNTPGITQCEVSRFYSSDPIDAAGPTFVNAVARIETSLLPLELLDILQKIEHLHGRQRPYRNAPRTLDLDLLLYDDLHIDEPRLTLPHPRMHLRAFVLRPLQELNPDIKILDKPLSNWINACSDQKIWPLE